LFEYLKETPASEQPGILVVKDDKGAAQAKAVADYLGKAAYVLPQLRVAPGEDLRSYDREIAELTAALGEYHARKGAKLLIAPFHTLTCPCPKGSISTD